MITIKPKRKYRKLEELLTEEQISAITEILDRSCVGNICVSRSQLYSELKEPLQLDMELYQFEKAITTAIKNDVIKGFETRAGRSGGICRKGVFLSADKSVWCVECVVDDVSLNSVGPLSGIDAAKVALRSMGELSVQEIRIKKLQ